MNKWLNIAASEEMDSGSASFAIKVASGLVKEQIGEPENVLCVGCSNGTELEMFINASGIDINDESIEVCKQK